MRGVIQLVHVRGRQLLQLQLLLGHVEVGREELPGELRVAVVLLVELQTKVREYFTITEKALTSTD